MTFLGIARGLKIKRLDYGDDTDYDPDAGIIEEF